MALPGIGTVFPKITVEYEQRKFRIMCGHRDRDEIAVRLLVDNQTVVVTATENEGRKYHKAEMTVDEFEKRFREFVINCQHAEDGEK